MHELSIAMSIVEMAEQESEQRGARVGAIHLRLGPLAGVVKEALLSAYELACENTSLEGSTLIVEDVPILVYCPQCRERRTLNSMRFQCPECQTPTPEVLQGRELEIFALELEEPA
ncbi:MAG TPA: hydrogenase maturation nickel metallochaperone HypA [Terriglobia bacterium]|jgi:hydrogenase nickel incorporation protein HypA/HybF|nr:hydrogenase maturation nickel metallochaperone HypA [Terriglobia bacterium]